MSWRALKRSLPGMWIGAWMLLTGGVAHAEDAAPAEAAAKVITPEPDFQAYIFWAYGLTCALLFAFTLWTVSQSRKLDERARYLDDRFRRAHPNADD